MVLIGGAEARAAASRRRSSSRACASASERRAARYKVTVRRVRGRNGGAAAPARSRSRPSEAPARAPRSRDRDRPRPGLARAAGARSRPSSSHTKENLQATIEELETSNEELQAANEELLASNEELQSTNEELQSVNEELYTVNAEYQRKIAELTELTNDMDNLLVEHRRRHHLPRPPAAHPQVHAADRRDLQPAAARRRAADRDLRAQAWTTRSWSTTSRGCSRPASRSSASCAIVRGPLVLPAHPALPREGQRRRRGAHADRRRAASRRPRTRCSTSATCSTACSRACPTRSTSRTRAAASSARTTRWRRGSGLDDPREAVGKTAFELPDTEAALALHQQDEAVLRTGRGAALPARAARATADGARARGTW